eukprot:sb/3476928/
MIEGPAAGRLPYFVELAHPLGAPQVRGLKDTRLRRVVLFIPTVAMAMKTKLICDTDRAGVLMRLTNYVKCDQIAGAVSKYQEDPKQLQSVIPVNRGPTVYNTKYSVEFSFYV